MYKISNIFEYACTFRGRTTILILAVLLINIIILALSAYFSHSNFQRLVEVKEAGIKKVILLNDLSNGVSKSTALLRNYLLTFENYHNEERAELWSLEIAPAMQELNDLKSVVLDEQLSLQIDSFLVQLRQIRGYQIEIENTLASDKRNEFSKKQANDLLQKRLLPATNRFYQIANKKLNTYKQLLNAQIQQIQGSIASQTAIMIANIVIIIILLLVLAGLIHTYVRNILHKLIKTLDSLIAGEAADILRQEPDPEVNLLIEKVNILSHSLQKASEFAHQIGEGNLEAHYEVKNEGDMLGKTLVEMRNYLKKIAQQDRERAWVAVGLAQFAELLQNTDQDLRTVSQKFVADLADYAQIAQVGIFVLQENENYFAQQQVRYLELLACYAYTRQKYLQKTIKIHSTYAEGLIGQAFLEKQTLYLKDVPQRYSNITSGLGEANPTYFLIVPIRREDQVEGVLELASFTPFANYQIEFLEKLAENYFFFIKADKVNKQTQKLLANSQEQAQILRTQEEEMRQNMEELQATQEEMVKKSKELERIIQASQEKEEFLNKIQKESEHLHNMLENQIYKQTLSIAELREQEQRLTLMLNHTDQIMVLLDKQMKVISYNSKFQEYCQLLHLDASKDTGITRYLLTENLNTFKEKVQKAQQNKQIVTFEAKIHTRDKEVSYLFGLKVVFNPKQELQNIVLYAQDITEAKQKEKRINNQQKLMQIASEMAQMGSWQIDIKQKTTLLSHNAAVILEVSETEFVNETNFFTKLIHPEDKAEFSRRTEEAMQLGHPFEIDVRAILPSQKVKWLKIAGRAIKNELKVPTEVNGFVQDITLYKLQEEELKKLKRAKVY